MSWKKVPAKKNRGRKIGWQAGLSYPSHRPWGLAAWEAGINMAAHGRWLISNLFSWSQQKYTAVYDAKICAHWWHQRLSLWRPSKVVFMMTIIATSDDKVGIMTTLGFLWSNYNLFRGEFLWMSLTNETTLQTPIGWVRSQNDPCIMTLLKPQ